MTWRITPYPEAIVDLPQCLPPIRNGTVASAVPSAEASTLILRAHHIAVGGSIAAVVVATVVAVVVAVSGGPYCSGPDRRRSIGPTIAIATIGGPTVGGPTIGHATTRDANSSATIGHATARNSPASNTRRANPASPDAAATVSLSVVGNKGYADNYGSRQANQSVTQHH